MEPLLAEVSQAHRFFQSCQSMPTGNVEFSLQHFDSKVMEESNNLYSMFDLVMIAKSNQLMSESPLEFFRRLITLICCINAEYELYHSKIKRISIFWAQACWNAKKQIQYLEIGSKSEEKLSIEIYRTKLLREEFLWLALRSFNSLLFKYNASNSIQHFTVRQLSRIKWLSKNIHEQYKKIIECFEYQTKYKIHVVMEYSKFLLITFRMRMDKSSTYKLFNEFIQTIISIIRLLKKFYSTSNLEFRNQINQLITSAIKVFINIIPINKLNMLYSFINYLNRKQPYYEILTNKKNSSNTKIMITKMLVRILKSWRDYQFQDTQLYENTTKLTQPIPPNPSEKQQPPPAQLLVKKIALPALEVSNEYKNTFRKQQLKKRRSLSIRLSKQKKQSYIAQSFVDLKSNLTNGIKQLRNCRTRTRTTSMPKLNCLLGGAAGAGHQGKIGFLSDIAVRKAKVRIQEKKRAHVLRPLKLQLRK